MTTDPQVCPSWAVQVGNYATPYDNLSHTDRLLT